MLIETGLSATIVAGYYFATRGNLKIFRQPRWS